MKVIKFGGTSVGSAHGLNCIKSIIENINEPTVAIVSALGGVTDQLILMSRLAASGDSQTYLKEFEAMSNRHFQAIKDSVHVSHQAHVRRTIEPLLEELKNLLMGVCLIGESSPKTLATIVSYGERLSSVIVAGIFENAKHIDAREVIKTEPYFGRHVVDFQLTNLLLEESLSLQHPIVVMGGFISSDKTTGETTNLGRGGSDYTASIIAAAMSASELIICTDVDGFMTADPRVINNAYLIERLSFLEAMELCNFGAKVIYPPTIFPAYHKNIPIYIKNTFNYECPGTFISDETDLDTKRVIKGISSINDTCMLTIKGLGMVGVIGVNYRIFRSLAKSGVSVFLVSQASSENSTSIAIRHADQDVAVETLENEFAQEISMGEIDRVIVDRNLATVAVVGQQMKDIPGIMGKLFGTLGRSGINVKTTAMGSTQTNISFVVEIENLRKTLNVIHDSFFLSEYQELNLFVTGIGWVGGKLLEQIHGQQQTLRENSGLKINVVGISNSKRSIFDREGIDLANYRELLESQGTPSTPQSVSESIKEMNIFNSVFVDCTANAEVSGQYIELLSNNISVVTANKIATSDSYENYTRLKSKARSRGAKFLYETNVGAGLPIINTIGDLCNSGDKILKLEAVVSGTLNYIFNVLSKDVPFSRAVKMAQEAGYAEPDPRIDLSGTDVVRKLVILARESGYKIEQADVTKNLFIPAELFEGSLEEFWAKVPELDAHFEQMRQGLEVEGKKLRFVATLDGGECSVGLREVDHNSPFHSLEGSNNIVLITTNRYREYPLQIKGYGAGASVTAAGVFADIISIANIR
ncbi:MAG: bifunctional aspartate kinase/homoserine dehydrogenase I [Rikenellaceae bacterium]